MENMVLYMAVREDLLSDGVVIEDRARATDIIALAAWDVDFSAQPLPGRALVPCEGAGDCVITNCAQAKANALALAPFQAAGYEVPHAKLIAVVVTAKVYIQQIAQIYDGAHIVAIERAGATHVIADIIDFR